MGTAVTAFSLCPIVTAPARLMTNYQKQDSAKQAAWRRWLEPNLDSHLLSNLLQQEKEHSKQHSQLLESACASTLSLGPIWPHVIMSVASSFDEARKRYSRCDLRRRLRFPCLFGESSHRHRLFVGPFQPLPLTRV